MRPPGSILEGAAFVLLGANPPTPSFSTYFVLKTLFLWRIVYSHIVSKTATVVQLWDGFVHLVTLKCCWCPWQPDWYKINNWNAKEKESHYFCVHGGWKVLILFCTWNPEKENPLWETTGNVNGKRRRNFRKKKESHRQEWEWHGGKVLDDTNNLTSSILIDLLCSIQHCMPAK